MTATFAGGLAFAQRSDAQSNFELNRISSLSIADGATTLIMQLPAKVDTASVSKPRATALSWRSPEDLVKTGFERSRVVMMNEAHNGMLRSVRTRIIGRRVLVATHAQGVRHIAMEALYKEFADEANKTRKVPKAEGYLGQPEMVSFIQSALDLGWTLIPYEAQDELYPSIVALGPWPSDPKEAADYQKKRNEITTSDEYTNWREKEQAKNLVSVLKALPDSSKLFVWCGNGHNIETPLNDWVPMGYQFVQLSGLDPFTIDQTPSIEFIDGQASSPFAGDFVKKHKKDLSMLGGTAGFVKEEAPDGFTGIYDAIILSTDNRLE